MKSEDQRDGELTPRFPCESFGEQVLSKKACQLTWVEVIGTTV